MQTLFEEMDEFESCRVENDPYVFENDAGERRLVNIRRTTLETVLNFEEIAYKAPHLSLRSPGFQMNQISWCTY